MIFPTDTSSSSSDTAEVDRLTSLLDNYEKTTQHHLSLIEGYKTASDTFAKRISDLEKSRASVVKRNKTLEQTIKFEKISTEGMKKKFHLMEGEVRDLRIEKDNFQSELLLLRTQTKELEQNLFTDRSKRLVVMHRNELLEKNSELLLLKCKEAEEDANKARTTLFERLQQFESVLSINESLKKTVTAQAEEMVLLQNQIFSLKENNLYTSMNLSEKEKDIANTNNDIEVLQQELFRLRKQLVQNCTGNFSSSFALSDFHGAEKANKLTTRLASKNKLPQVDSNNNTIKKDNNNNNNNNSVDPNRSFSTISDQFSHFHYNNNNPPRLSPLRDIHYTNNNNNNNSVVTSKASLHNNNNIINNNNNNSVLTPKASLHRPHGDLFSVTGIGEKQDEQDRLDYIQQVLGRTTLSNNNNNKDKTNKDKTTTSNNNNLTSSSLQQLRQVYSSDSLTLTSEDLKVVATDHYPLEQLSLGKTGLVPNYNNNNNSFSAPKKKTLFVSSGLGFRSDSSLDEELYRITNNSGTAKEMIKKILSKSNGEFD